jgi:PPOX class probable F420-dependent enzyme
MLTRAQRRFLCAHRVARFASADPAGQPHVLPVCFTVKDDTAYFSIDEKPKAVGAWRLKRMRNIAANPRVALVVDRYDEDWTRLGWVMLQGRAEVLAGGDEHRLAQAALRRRYAQLQAMDIDALPVVAIRVERVTSWGSLDPTP